MTVTCETANNKRAKHKQMSTDRQKEWTKNDRHTDKQTSYD